jgi:SAM-dependent methyltransferase
VLDFGCGPGRIALWMEDVGRRGELHGVDIDERAIRWAQRNIPWGTFKANKPEPPLEYPDGYFDLIYNHSVLTHLDEDLQDRWLAELHRITSPGATVLLSFHGQHAFEDFESKTRENGGDPALVRQRYDREGIVYLNEDAWLGSAHPDSYHTTFHAPWYVRQHWGSFFEVHTHIPQGALGYQDLIVLKRREGELPSGEAAHPSDAEAPAPRRRTARVRAMLTRRLRDDILPHIGPLAREHERVKRAERTGGLVRAGLLRQSQRISRLELELLDRIDELERRIAELERPGRSE